MAGVDVGTAYLTVVPSAKGFAGKLQSELGGGMDSAGKKAGDTAGRAFGSTFKGGIGTAAKAGALALAGVAAVGIGFLKDSVAEARESQKVGAITTQIIKSTGGAAKITADQVGDLATAISNKTGVDDEAIQAGANMLLTFKNVKNEVGDGAKIFDRATQAAADLSAAGFGDMAGQSKMLGKALNDPIKGISALSRSGVTFTKQQQEQIKTLVKSGKTLDAQKIILGEVESQVGGTAAASATAGEKMATSFGNFKEQIGTALLPVIDKVANFMTEKAIPAVSSFFKGLQDGTGVGGQVAAKVALIVAAVKNFITEFQNGTGVGGTFRTVLETIVAVAINVAKWIGENATVVKALAAAVLGGVAAFQVISGVVRVYTAIQGVLNAVMAANPIGIVVIAIAALAAGLIYAYKNSDTFRKVVDTAFKAIAAVGRWLWNTIFAPFFRFLVNGFATLMDWIGNFLDALSNVPGFGWAKDAAAKMHGAARGAEDLAKKITDIPDNTNITVTTTYVYKQQGVKLRQQNDRKLEVNGVRAGGGPVRAGGTYLVGEHEPELFVPDRPGTILNQKQMAALGGGGLSQHDINRIAVALSQVQVQATISAGTFDRAMGARR